MKVLLDCDVLLDVVLNRAPYRDASARLLDWAERHPGRCVVAWHTLSNLFYLAEGNVRAFVGELLAFADVPRTGTDDVRYALSLPMQDLEDAMQSAAAVAARADFIATRNVRHFKQSPVPALTPERILEHLRA